MRLHSRLLRPAAALAAAASIPVLSACGGSGADPAADPAAIVPARTAIYVEANFKPGDDVTELARKLSGEQDPGQALRRLIEREAREDDPDFRYSEDVEPWIGERAAVFVPRITTGEENPAGAVLPTKDADKAEEALENDLREGEEGQDRPQVTERTHRDTKYLFDTANDQGFAILDDYAVIGSDAALKAAIDARDGEALAESSEYRSARDAVEEDRVGFMYVRLSQVFSGLGPQGAALREALSGLGETIAVGLDGDASSIKLESASLGVSGEAGPTGAGEVLTELPASAWFAFGTSDLGGRIEDAIERFTSIGGLGGQDPRQLLDQLEAQLGIDPRRDLASWLGDVGVFAFGDTPNEFGAGLVATTKDAAAARRSIPRIVQFLARVGRLSARPLDRSGVDTGFTLRGAQLPLPLHVVLTDDDRFLVALTDAALAQSLQDTDALGESSAFRDAARRLGEGIEPTVFLNFAPLGGFLDAAGATRNPDAARVRRALDRLTTLAAGSRRDGETLRGRLVVGVK
jgi:hypothetical protein